MTLHDRDRIAERLRSVTDPVALLINLFTHAPVGFAVWTPDGKPVLTNKAFLDLFGSEPPPEYNVLEDDIVRASGMLALFEKAFAGETVQVPTFWFDPRDLTSVKVTEGRRVAISMTIFPVFGAGGTIEYVAATYKDETTGMTAAEETRAVMDAALDSIIVMDHEGNILDINPAAERMFGYSRAEIAGRSLAETIVPPAMREAHERGLARYLASAETRVIGTRVELSAMTREGREFPAEIAIVRIGTETPKFTGYVRDITERTRAAEAEILRRAKDAAEAANVELEAFSYSIAHDLRAPLRSISGFGNALLEETALDDAARSHLDRIIGAATRMDQLIDGLLAIARISKHDLHYETVDLSKLAHELIPVDTDRRVRWTIASDLTVRGDPVLLYSVMQNLISNAWKFTSRTPDAHVEIGAVRGDGPTVFFVKDNGAGFDPRHADQLFKPFRRLHRASEFEGTGIGLATVHRIIRRHGGRIWCEGRLDQGATFHFTL
jgi:PAS domain S-box-containing protein